MNRPSSWPRGRAKKEERITLYSRAREESEPRLVLPSFPSSVPAHSLAARSLPLPFVESWAGRTGAGGSGVAPSPSIPPLLSPPLPTPTASGDAQDENDLGKLARATSAEKGVQSSNSGSALRKLLMRRIPGATAGRISREEVSLWRAACMGQQKRREREGSVSWLQLRCS